MNADKKVLHGEITCKTFFNHKTILNNVHMYEVMLHK